MRAHDEQGVAFPSPLVMLSLTAVAMAGIAYAVTADDPTPERQAVVVAQPSPTTPAAPEPIRRSQPTVTAKPKPKPPAVDRSSVYVVIFNNSGITGLAGATAGKAAGAGWQVVGSDNWVGTIPSSTVYYPDRLRAAAKVLARDLGIRRLMPAVDPMQFDRLTVILTADYG